MGWILYALLISIFTIGYMAIVLEYVIRINKSAVALFMACLCWVVYFLVGHAPLEVDLQHFNDLLSEVSQIIFFLLGAMTVVELIDSHKGFKIVTDLIATRSRRKLLLIVVSLSFFLSAILDNLTTAILMTSLVKKILSDKKERLLLSAFIIVAANAGGAWTPIGDVTTTMLWINKKITPLSVMFNVFLPSVVSVLVPVLFFLRKIKGEFLEQTLEKQELEPGANLVFFLGIGALVFVPVFKSVTHLPPFMGVLFGLSVLWLVTDWLHHKYDQRQHLRVPSVLMRIDMSGILFFLGILLCINALEASSLLQMAASGLSYLLVDSTALAALLGIISAVVDNVPLVAAAMAMYPLSLFPTDSSFWHMVAYAAGTGGSLLLIGSSPGVAVMSLEKDLTFFVYMRKMTIPVLVGYLLGIAVYLLQQKIFLGLGI